MTYYANNQTGPCLNNGTCVNLEGGYNCTCLEGWGGKNCENSKFKIIKMTCWKKKLSARSMYHVDRNNNTHRLPWWR